MDDSFDQGTKQLYQNFLRTLPIWSYSDKFRAQFEQIKYEFQEYLTRLDDRETRISKLPKLNLTFESRVLSNDTSNDMDIVLTYRKVNGQYQLYDEDKERERRKKASRDPYRTVSLITLEEQITADEEVYAMIRPGRPWVKCKIISVFRRPSKDPVNKLMITFRLRTPEDCHPRVIDVDKYSVARIQDHQDNLKPSKRVIAGLVRSNMMPGIVGEQPDVSTNKFRYLVHMDDGSAKYFKPEQVYPILGQTPYPWEDVRKTGNENPDNVGYLRHFFSLFPKKHILLAKVGDSIKLFRNGILLDATLIGIDCNTIRLLYKDNTEESIYRGSPRFLGRSEVVAKQLAGARNLEHFNEILLIHMHLYHEASRRALDEDIYGFMEDFNKKVTISKNHNTARKSTAKRGSSPKRVRVSLDGHTVPENRGKIDYLREDDDSRSHKCSSFCLSVPGLKTETSVRNLIDEYRNVSDLKVPLLLGWKRKLQKVPSNTRNAKVKIVITYEAPCGKVFQQPYNVRRYLLKTGSIFDVDYFSFDRDIELNRQSGDIFAYVSEKNIAVNPKTGEPLENKYISLVNQFNEERLPEDFEYRNESFPHHMLKLRGFSFNHEFKSSCDCDDDCSQRATCSCHRLNEEFFGSNGHNKGTVENRCQYNHKRLTSQVGTGIFECNSFCKCSSKCSNRVVQNGMRFRLQVRKTLNKGWGVITLDDIPNGAFICTYAAELLDDADLYGDSDMYYADLDYITENERGKTVESSDEKSDEGVDTDSDVGEPSAGFKRRGDRKVISESDESQEGSPKDADDNSCSSSSDEVVIIDKYLPNGSSTISTSRYPKREVQKQQQRQNQTMQGSESQSRGQTKFKKIHDLLKSHDFTLDARMQGNVGRFFNHSCDPNSYVQNIFIETHDLRFPVVAFFAMKTIKALGEITWNYRYKVGSIPGRRIDCHCGASNCAGRIL